jgi:hypothetical protein
MIINQLSNHQLTMKNITLFSMIFLPAILLLSTADVSAKSTPGKNTFELAYKVGPGKSFTMKNEGTTTIQTDQMGQTMTVDMNSANETVCRVLSVTSGGTMQYEMEFKLRKQSAKSPLGSNDSDFSTWIGKKVGFNLSPQGTISDFKGFDQLPAITSAAGEKITGELIQKGMKEQFFKLPDHPVKIGETWTIKDSTEIPYAGSTLKSVTSTTYTAAEKVDKDGLECLRIDISASSKLTGEFEQQNTQIELTREIKSTGVMFFALEKGMYLSIESTSVGTSEIYIPANGSKIPQQINGKQSMKVVFD